MSQLLKERLERTFPPVSLERLNFLFSQRVIAKETNEGRKLVSSIESLTFSVTSEDDLAITVKDAEGWQLNESVSQLVNVFLQYLNTLVIFQTCNSLAIM